MDTRLTIVAYHYVRDLSRSRFPALRGLPVERFREQLGYFRQHYNLIRGDDLLAAVAEGAPLPPRALLLTFDDGYADHFTHVWPILDDLGLSGCFFPPARPLLEATVLDVNKLHFVLASVANPRVIVERVMRLLDGCRAAYDLLPNETYWQRLARPGRFDPAEVMFIKRLLQRELPAPVRQALLDDLFRQYVTGDEAAFSAELYMSLDQLRCLCRHGHILGSHGYSHAWLDHLDPAGQAMELERSLELLALIGVPLDRWMMCYPYGAHDAALLSALRARGCTVGLTTRADVADLRRDNPLTLPRLDTNDLPAAALAPNRWLEQVRV